MVSTAPNLWKRRFTTPVRDNYPVLQAAYFRFSLHRENKNVKYREGCPLQCFLLQRQDCVSRIKLFSKNGLRRASGLFLKISTVKQNAHRPPIGQMNIHVCSENPGFQTLAKTLPQLSNQVFISCHSRFCWRRKMK